MVSRLFFPSFQMAVYWNDAFPNKLQPVAPMDPIEHQKSRQRRKSSYHGGTPLYFQICEQNNAVRREAPIDSFFQERESGRTVPPDSMSFHVGKDFEELSSDDAWGEMDTHMRYLLETGCGKHHQFQGPHSLHLNSDKENAAAYFCRFVKLYGNIYQNTNIQKGLLDTSCGCHAAFPICFAVDSPSTSVSCGGIFVNAVWHNT